MLFPGCAARSRLGSPLEARTGAVKAGRILGDSHGHCPHVLLHLERPPFYALDGRDVLGRELGAPRRLLSSGIRPGVCQPVEVLHTLGPRVGL